MKIYLRYKDVPELAPLSPKDRRAVVRYCFYRFTFRHWQCWVAIIVFFLFVVALGTVAGVAAQYGLGFQEVVLYACILIAVSIGSLIHSNILVGQLRPHFREYLARKHGIV